MQYLNRTANKGGGWTQVYYPGEPIHHWVRTSMYLNPFPNAELNLANVIRNTANVIRNATISVQSWRQFAL